MTGVRSLLYRYSRLLVGIGVFSVVVTLLLASYTSEFPRYRYKPDLDLFVGPVGESGVMNGILKPEGDTPKPEENGPVFVLVLAYMRSGSSFTADLIHHHSDTFYVFEPLHTWWLNYRKKYKLNITDIFDYHTEDGDKQKVEHLNDWFNCNFTMDSFALRPAEGKFCQLSKTKDRKFCLKILIDKCKKSRFRVIKTIRLSIPDISSYFTNTPNLKIIHLIRDPRAIRLSRSKISFKYVKSNESVKCSMMVNDLMWGTKLIPRDRYRLLRYETVAENPYSCMMSIYDFLGLRPTFESIGQLYVDTHAQIKKERMFSTARRDSNQTAHRWRLKATAKFVKDVDNSCTGLYKIGGYRQADIKTIKDLNQSLKTKQNGTFFDIPEEYL